jgi:hypothetical protein
VICSNELQSSTFSLSSSLSLRVHSMLMKDYTRFAVYSPAHSTMHLHDDGLFIVLRSAGQGSGAIFCNWKMQRAAL